MISTVADNQTESLISKLRAIREERGITRPMLADKLGITPASLYRWETVKAKRLLVSSLFEYAEALDLKLEIRLKDGSEEVYSDFG